MVTFLNHTTLARITRLCIGLISLTWVGSTHAAQLKDIRVGEYNEFTRIVFESDGPMANPKIEIGPSGQLLITFQKAGVRLIRKIPVGKSPRIKDIQIWQQRGKLSVLLISIHPNIRIESFRLSRPHRFAVDIFPNIMPGPAKENTQHPRDGKPIPAAKKSSASEKSSTTTAGIDHGTNTEPGRKIETLDIVDPDDTLSVAENKAQSTMHKQLVPQSAKTDLSTVPDKLPPPHHRMQLYLVFTLMIITIAILLLLVLMLLTSRHRLPNHKTAPKPSQPHADTKIDPAGKKDEDPYKPAR
jgi:hypothetical protein